MVLNLLEGRWLLQQTEEREVIESRRQASWFDGRNSRGGPQKRQTDTEYEKVNGRDRDYDGESKFFWRQRCQRPRKENYLIE